MKVHYAAAMVLAAWLQAMPALAGPHEDAFAAVDANQFDTAIAIWQPMANQGDARAQTNIGMLHALGEGFPQSFDAAAEWYLKAAEQDYVAAQVLLAGYHRERKDYALAAKWYGRAADRGDATAGYWMGLLLLSGKDGVAFDPIRAYALLHRAGEDQEVLPEMREGARKTLAMLEKEFTGEELAQARQAAGIASAERPAAADDADAPEFPPNAWRVRRRGFQQAALRFRDSDGQDGEAKAAMDAAAEALRRDFLAVTPIEAMEIYANTMRPRGDKEMPEAFRDIAMIATLGAYDMARFAEASGEAEIVNNEAFFKLVFIMGGDESVKRATDFMSRHPKEAAAAVKEGIDLAASVRHRVRYDVRWPASYGLSRTRCALSGGSDCPPGESLPREQWDAAFVQAAKRVEHYYRINR